MKHDFLWPYHFAVDGECIWFVPYWYNMLCKYNVQTRQIESMQTLPQENTVEGLYLNLVKIGNCILLIPMYAKNVCIYYIDTGEFLELETGCGDKVDSQLYTYGMWKPDVYLFSVMHPVALKLDVAAKKMEYIHFDFAYSQGGSLPFFLMQSSTSSHFIYLPVAKKNYILKFDMDTEKYCFLKIGGEDSYFLSVCKASTGKLFLINQKGELIVYNETDAVAETVKSLVFEGCNENCFNNCQYFIESMEYGRSVFFFTSGRVIAVDTENHSVGKAWFSDALFLEENQRRKDYPDNFFAVKKDGKYLYVENRAGGYYYRIDLDAKTVEPFDILAGGMAQEDRVTMFAQYRNIAQEGKALYFSLDTMFDQLGRENNKANVPTGIGKQIWDTLKNK